MFKIAICDDNVEICSEIENMVYNFYVVEKIKPEIDIYHSGERLISSLKEHEKYDLIYLDIELMLINGIAVARFIREVLKDENTQIAFISAKESYALELFQVRPIDFLVKPLKEKQVIQVLEKSMEFLGQPQKMFLYLSSKI